MIRTDKFLISKRRYAVDPTTYTVHPTGLVTISAVWFRRKDGVNAACTGFLWDYRRGTAPGEWRHFLETFTDGRYGGDCEGRWDGDNYWGAQNLVTMNEHLALLRPMLADYPDIPQGWDGWWTFHDA